MTELLTENRLLQAVATLTREAASAASTLDATRRALAEAEARRDTAEEQVRQLLKLEALGQLTGGIAHDFNNMLSVVISGLSLVQRRLSRGDPDIGRFVEASMAGAQRAATLTRRLLEFSRQQPLALVQVDANELVQGMEELLRRTLGEAIELEIILADALWPTCADPSQFENALLNLAVNARDAMGEAGRLTVATANCHLDAEHARGKGWVAGDYVRLSVTDIGTGMAPEVIARAFEPFFTTKRIGAGTGLGLSQVHAFARQSTGHVDITSEVGRGTTVMLYLPRHTGGIEAASSAIPLESVRAGAAGETILLVENEERVREVAVLGLAELGYRVVESDSAIGALRKIDAHPEVTLLFTDVVMPGVDGRSLADEALRRRPGLKLLFTTGCARRAMEIEATPDVGPHLLPKPYDLDQLAAKIRHVLDR